MIDPNWKNDPLLKQMPPDKLDFLTAAIEHAGSLPENELGPYFFSVITNANKQNMVFNDAETQLIVRVLSSGMSDAERKRMETIQKMTRIISRSQKHPQ